MCVYLLFLNVKENEFLCDPKSSAYNTTTNFPALLLLLSHYLLSNSHPVTIPPSLFPLPHCCRSWLVSGSDSLPAIAKSIRPPSTLRRERREDEPLYDSAAGRPYLHHPMEHNTVEALHSPCWCCANCQGCLRFTFPSLLLQYIRCCVFMFACVHMCSRQVIVLKLIQAKFSSKIDSSDLQ